MAVDVSFGTFTTPSGTGVAEVVSGLSFQPDCYMLWGNVVTDESVNVDATSYMGATDGSFERSIAMYDEDGVSDTRRDVGTTPNRVLIARRPEEADDTRIFSASHSSMNSGGFSLDFDVAASGYVVHWMAIGGTTNLVMGEVVANNSPVTGLGFQPDFLFAFTAGLNLSGSPSQHCCHGWGVADGTNEWWLAQYNSDNNTDNKDSLIYSSGFVGQQYNGNRTWQASLTSFDTGGFTWSGSNSDGFYYIAFETGGAMECNDFTKATGAAPAAQDLPAAGFTPGVYLLASGSEINETVNSPNGCHASFGVTDGVNSNHIFRTSPNNTNNSDQRQDNDNLLMVGKSANAVPDATAAASAISDSSPTITWDPNNGSAYIIGVWYIEKTAAGLGMPIAMDHYKKMRNA